MIPRCGAGGLCFLGACELSISELSNLGEAACIENITFRCRNEQMRGQCVYIVMGQLHLVRCNVDGGVFVSGARTAPRFSECRIRKSRGNGMRFTDHAHASMRGKLCRTSWRPWGPH